MGEEKAFGIDQTWLQCINCGTRRDLLGERKFRCPNCNGLFEINHDFSLLGMCPGELRNLFEKRAAAASSNSSPVWQRSGIWQYRELIMPFMPEEMIVTLGEGKVPIIRAGKNLLKWIGQDIDLWLILEGMTPTGSFKDYGGTVVMSVAKAAGIKVVICASTGDTSAMAAAYSAATGITCVVILPRGKVTTAQLVQALVHGAKVITLPGSFDDCMKVVERLVEDYGAYPVNSLNPSRIEGHQATVFQIAQFFNWRMPDWIALPVGNGSNCSSVTKGIRLLKRLAIIEGGFFKNQVRILGCQSEAADPLSRSFPVDASLHKTRGDCLVAWKESYQPVTVGESTATATLIGDPVSRDKVMDGVVRSGGMMTISKEADLNEAVVICGRDGIFVCPQTGIALAGVRNAVKQGRILDGETVVVVSTATGLKFTEPVAVRLGKEIIEAKDRAVETTAKIIGL